MAPPLPPKTIQYINNTLVGHDDQWAKEQAIKERPLNGGEEEVERVEIVDQRQSMNSLGYENAKVGVGGVDDERPPQIPPKPKAR